jgi:hypothetical protein
MLVQLERNTKRAAVARIMRKPVKRDTCYGNSSVWFSMVVCERHDAVCGTAVRQRGETWPTCECRVGCLNTTVQKNGYEGKTER